MRRELISEAEREAGQLADTREVAVAFADLVDYTRMGERLAPEGVGRIAGRLSQMAVSTVVPEVQLVKMIGDAAMFVSPSAAALMETVQALVKCIRDEDKSFTDVRVGIAAGPATTRGGDWFGRPVNLASRVTDLAKPGTVLATEEVQELTPDLPWDRKRRRRIKGVEGRVRLYELEKAK
jgi:adenylate cyclase